MEASSDLDNWSDAAVSHGDPVQNGNGTVAVTYRDVQPIGESNQRFLRLGIEVDL